MLPAKFRIARKEYPSIELLRKSKPIFSAFFSVKIVPSPKNTQFSVKILKKTVKKAVLRNFIRRVLYRVIYENISDFPKGNYYCILVNTVPMGSRKEIQEKLVQDFMKLQKIVCKK